MGEEGRQPLSHLRRKWEADLGKEIPETAWSRIVEKAWKNTRNARFQLIHFYVLHRAYLTLARINKYFNVDTARCPLTQLGRGRIYPYDVELPAIRNILGGSD